MPSRTTVWAGIFGFAVAVGYMPGALDSAQLPRFAILSLGLPLLARENWKAPVSWFAALLGLATISLLRAIELPDGIWGIWLLGLLWLGTLVSQREAVMTGAALGLALEGVLVLTQRFFSWPELNFVGAPAGTFYNVDFLGEASALALLWCLPWPGERTWKLWLAPLLGLGLILTGSRNGELAVMLGLVIWGWKQEQLRKIAAAAVLGLGVLVLWKSLQPGVYENGEAILTGSRLEIWKHTVAGTEFWGRGIGQYYVTLPQTAKAWIVAHDARPAEAHNEFLQMFYELGIPGGILFLLGMGGAALRAVQLRSSFGLLFLGFCNECIFGFPRQLPVTLLLGSLALGAVLCSSSHSRSRFLRRKLSF